jgi:small subunit ribosomal protein S2
MSSLVTELIEAGIHFGQRRSNWNPKMQPYIYDVRNQIHIIDIKETIKGLLRAKKFISTVVGRGKDVCFVGTKRQAQGAIEQYANDVKMPYVTERWLGGTLTNYRTIRDRLKRLEELERLVETGEINSYSKKMESQLTRERKKIFRNLHGLRTMTKLPGALIVVDVNRELNALREARILGIPTICLIDTDGDPDMADIPIPGNDDSMRSIDVIVRELCAAVKEGRTSQVEAGQTPVDAPGGSAAQSPTAPQRRRSSRSQFRADDAAAERTMSAVSEAPPVASSGVEKI